MNPPTPPASSTSQPSTVEDARGKPSFRKWRAKIEKRKGMENLEERTFQYGGYKFVWGNDNQDDEEKRLLNRIVTVTNNNLKKDKKELQAMLMLSLGHQ
jgi:hypothetical protein